MFFIRILILIVSLFSIVSMETSFAASGSGNIVSESGTTKTRDSEKIDTILAEEVVTTEEEKIAEEKTEKNAQKIILEVYKIQGNKILKDMDISIEKVNPDPKIRIDIYSSIQKTLALRKQKVEKGEMSNESKDILTGYINYMVSAIEKKKKNLE